MKLLTLFEQILSEDYYNSTLPDDVKRYSNRYEGRNVIWYGDPEQMIVIHKDDIFGMWGNEYDTEKFDYLVDLILHHEDKIELECSYGMGGMDNIIDVIEEQGAYYEDRFEVDYDGKTNPASCGNVEFDKYLGVDDYMVDEYNTSLKEVDDFFKIYKLSILRGKESPESLIAKFKGLEIDQTDGEDYKGEEDYDAFKEFIRIEVGIKEASDKGYGDINNFTVQLRDGHHRVMGAIKSGEEYVCLNLVKEDLEEYKGHYQRVLTSDETN